MRTLLQSDENYYNSKRANTQSFQNFIRILIVVFFGAFIVNTPWGSLHFPLLAYIGTASLIISIVLNIYMYPIAQKALDEFREATHKTFNENDITYINETPNAYKKFSRLSKLLMFCLALSIVFCSISYITEKTLGPKEVKQMAKKQQSTQQPSRKTWRQKKMNDYGIRPLVLLPQHLLLRPLIRRHNLRNLQNRNSNHRSQRNQQNRHSNQARKKSSDLIKRHKARLIASVPAQRTQNGCRRISNAIRTPQPQKS